MTVLQGALTDRDTWSAVGECPIEKTMAVLGTKSAILIMREAYYGTSRFDDFARRVGITKAATATGLARLVDLGLLARRPYRDPGQRRRDEYVLTPAGIDFMPVVWAMFQWGQRHLANSTPLRLTHVDCGAEAAVEIRCAKGHRVPATELGARLVKSRRSGIPDTTRITSRPVSAQR
ncbi:winged helix-turn-helix transcriptional regulator [Mycobacterium sp. pUA109]|uniref:winged helix-turn-helix transcriptional regulator n=1 Tax=Mycobacterium sp. pUA109 TaxID=3238982 RepID=UPI00351ADCC7